MTLLAPVAQDVLDDLRDRLARTRLVEPVPGDGRGVDLEVLQTLLDHWATAYDWRAHEERLLSLPWVTTGTGAVNAIHHRAGEDADTLVLLHGWPDSVLRFERVLPLLTDLNVVIPALPGYPYSAAPRHGNSTDRGGDAVPRAQPAVAGDGGRLRTATGDEAEHAVGRPR
jgi:hypothetical protein